MTAATLFIVTKSSHGDTDQTEHVERVIAFPPGGTLEVHNFSGAVLITGTTGKDVEIKAIRRGKRELLDHITLDIRASASGVMIDANRCDPGWKHKNDNVVETSFEIKVPASAKLDVDVFSSDLDIKGISGAERLKTFSGNISVDAACAGGNPQLTAETFSGSIRTRLAHSVKGEVNFSSFSGNFDSELPLTLRSADHGRTALSTTESASGRTLTFKTFSGQVQVIK